MIKFYEWAFSRDAPFWAEVTVLFLTATVSAFVFMICVAALLAGYWLVPVLVLLVIPAYLVVKAYMESTKEDGDRK